jgi:hypothetical protein
MYNIYLNSDRAGGNPQHDHQATVSKGFQNHSHETVNANWKVEQESTSFVAWNQQVGQV